MKNQPILSRRRFVKTAAVLGASFAIRKGFAAESSSNRVRLGGPVFEKYDSPEGWVKAVQNLGYSATYCPVDAKASDDAVSAYAKAAQEADIVIAEVGAWSNPIDSNEEKRKTALDLCKTQLDLADRIGANCCVNISGARGDDWDGHDPKNLTPETFDMIVQSVREIIDAVKPTRTFYTLETMPWAYPDSADSYLALMKAIDRKEFAAHLDPVNNVVSPQVYYNNGALIREFFEKLGPHIRSCHAKDITMSQEFMVHLSEVRPGLGHLDYAVFLKEANRFKNTPLMLEHLREAEEYRQAAEYVRSVAKKTGVSL